MSRNVVVVESRIPEIIATSEARATAAVAKTGVDIEAGARANIVQNGSVDTGNMLNSVAWAPGEDLLSGEIVVGAGYGAYVEYGTVHPERAYRNREGELDVMDAYTIAPKPFLAPAAEEARAPFEAAVSQLYA